MSAFSPTGSWSPAGGIRASSRTGAVAWRGDRIVEVGEHGALTGRYPGARLLDARGGLILPGLINIHHHFYSALARGLNPGTPMRDFPEVLDRLWWRLDRALDPETVGISALLSAADCIRWGCTTVFDHHASPTCIEGSLDLIAGAVETAGISAVLCYEVTDRNGPEGALAGIEENLRFLGRRRDDPRIRGVFGVHASFTVRDETLALIARATTAGSGLPHPCGRGPGGRAGIRQTPSGGGRSRGWNGPGSWTAGHSWPTESTWRRRTTGRWPRPERR